VACKMRAELYRYSASSKVHHSRGSAKAAFHVQWKTTEPCCGTIISKTCASEAIHRLSTQAAILPLLNCGVVGIDRDPEISEFGKF
jgi:hypothetical protein